MEEQEATMDENDINDILQYYPGVEDIARYLLEHHVAISAEGGFSLMRDEEVVANAMLDQKSLKLSLTPSTRVHGKLSKRLAIKLLPQMIWKPLKR